MCIYKLTVKLRRVNVIDQEIVKKYLDRTSMRQCSICLAQLLRKQCNIESFLAVIELTMAIHSKRKSEDVSFVQKPNEIPLTFLVRC
jgi:hypothetical protein